MKEGRRLLENLNQELKNRIIEEYGSLDYLYFEVYYLERKLYQNYLEKNHKEVARIRGLVMDIDDKLEEFGAIDGSDITHPIGTDFSEEAASNTIRKNFKNLGFSEDLINAWIKSKGIDSSE